MANQDHLEAMKEMCKSLAEVPTGETNRLAAKLWELSMHYMDDVRERARRSFVSALLISFVGIAFFFLALGLMVFGLLPFSRLTLIAGMSIQVVSAIGFYLYAQTTKEFFTFHLCLERANRYLLANTICEKMEQPYRDQTRSKLVHLIASAPPLSVSLVEHGVSDTAHTETQSTSTTSQPASVNRELVTAE